MSGTPMEVLSYVHVSPAAGDDRVVLTPEDGTGQTLPLAAAAAVLASQPLIVLVVRGGSFRRFGSLPVS